MGQIGGLLGMGGGASGTGYAAPHGTNPADLKRAEEQQQAALAQQQAFTTAVNPGATSALGSQQSLLGQLEQGAQGKGPNPALAQLQQTTGQNVSNQAALMAGQRGASANTGLMARQAAHQGAATQQQAAGQGATMAAQQQLAQQQALAQQQQAMVGQGQASLNALNQAGNTHQGNILGMQGNINNANAGLASTTMGGQGNMLGGLMGGIGSAVNMFGGSSGGGGGVAGGGLSDTDIMGAQEGFYAQGGQVQRMADGGTLMQVNQPGVLGASQISNPAEDVGPQSAVGRALMDSGPKIAPKSGGGGGMNPMAMLGGGLGGIGGGMAGGSGGGGGSSGGEKKFNGAGMLVGGAKGAATGATIGGLFGGVGAVPGAIIGGGLGAIGGSGMLAEGGEVPVLLSPGERKLSPEQARLAAGGKLNPMKAGEKVPGKPKVGGAKNDYANDTHEDSVQAGSIIIPRSVTQGKDAEKKSIAFVQACLAKHGIKGKK